MAFASKTNVVHAPIHDAQYGWFVIEPISNVHPRSTTPEKQVAATIKQQLLQQKKNAGDDHLGLGPHEELLRRQEDQVPGRLHADA